jgi:hypothetical protein
MPPRRQITADPSLAQAKKTNPTFKALMEQPHSHGESIREDSYKGHHVVIRTNYDIEIDGRPFHGNLDVTNAGTVHYHGIPNVSTNSAIDLIRAVIDAFPADFPAGGSEEPPHDGHEGHHHAPARQAVRRRKAAARSVKRATAKRPKSAAKERRHARSRKHSH